MSRKTDENIVIGDHLFVVGINRIDHEVSKIAHDNVLRFSSIRNSGRVSNLVVAWLTAFILR